MQQLHELISVKRNDIVAAYQCLNCHSIERSGEDCCDNPELFCVNDMPEEIKRLRKIAQAPQAAPVALTPLTQDAVLDMAEGVSLQFHDLLAFARAIERAHGIGAAAQGGEHGILR